MKMSPELEKLRLIDISSEDDFLIDSQLCDSFTGFRLSVAFDDKDIRDKFEPFPAGNRSKVASSGDVFGNQDNRRDGERNSRKSLAWDSAFFTSAGVLDPEELSMINEGFRKTEMHLLPGIEEELQASAEPNCTTDSNNGFSFESLEIDPLKDPKALNRKPRRSPFVACAGYASERVDDKKKSEATPRNIRNARSKEPNSSYLRPSKLAGRSTPVSSATPAKRASFGNAGNEHTTASKKPCLSNGCQVSTPGSTRSSSFGSSTITSVSGSSYSSSDRSTNAASCDSSSKSLWNSLRRNKSRLESSSNSTGTSMPKLSYSLSPASSMGHWSAESVSHSGNNKGTRLSKGNMDGVLFSFEAAEASDLKSSPVSADVLSRFKASGLRMPSPKIGYFDLEKSPVKTPNELQFFHAQKGSSPKPEFKASNITSLSVPSRNRQTSLSTASKSRPNLSPERRLKNRKGLVQTHVKTNNKIVQRKGNGKENPYLSYAANGKENLYKNKDGVVDGLCKHLGAVALSNDVVI